MMSLEDSEDYKQVETTPNYFNWKEVYPELQVLLDNFQVISEEAKNIGMVNG